MKEVAIAYHYIAHYRKAVFTELCKDRNIDIRYSIFSDECSNISSIKVLSSDPSSGENISRHWNRLQNFWLTKNILWQRGIISTAIGRKYSVLILLGNMYFLSTWVAVILARLRGKKVYFWTHGFRVNERGIKGRLRFCFYKLANGLLLYGNHAKKILVDKGYSAKKLHVIYNSLDYCDQTARLSSIKPEHIVEKKIQLGISENEKIIIASGRVTRDKRFDLLIDALHRLTVDSSSVYRLIIIGDGPEKAVVERRAETLSVSGQVVFYGACYDENEIALLISMSDVFVVPGDIGLSGIHSLTYGTPVVTHDDFSTHKPEYEAIIDGVNGGFYKKGDVDDMVSKINYWASQDRAKTFDDCRSIIQKYYNPAYQIKIIDKVILDCL